MSLHCQRRIPPFSVDIRVAREACRSLFLSGGSVAANDPFPRILHQKMKAACGKRRGGLNVSWNFLWNSGHSSNQDKVLLYETWFCIVKFKQKRKKIGEKIVAI